MKIKNDNSGMSLIELIIVIAIITVLAGAAGVSYNIIKNADITKSEKNINSCYSKLRVYTMSQAGSWKLQIYKEQGKYYGSIYQDNEKKGGKTELGKYIDIYFKDQNGNENKIDEDNGLIIVMKPSTGGLNTITYGNQQIFDSSKEDNSSYGEIIIKRKSRKTSIKIYYVTGKNITE